MTRPSRRTLTALAAGQLPAMTEREFQRQESRLVFIRRVSGVADRGVFACSCGREKEIRISHVRRGKIRSCGCGCLKNHFSKEASTTHGKYGTPEYRSWSSMKNRCINPKAGDYDRYGGRGIKVCERWLSFEAFFADMGLRPGPDYSIDRVNNAGNYEPGNCRWATRSEQGRNKRSNVILEVDGQKITAAEWSEVSGIALGTILLRIKKGWTAKRAVTEAVGRWARLLCDQCRGCGTSERPHRAKGLCNACYNKEYKAKNIRE